MAYLSFLSYGSGGSRSFYKEDTYLSRDRSQRISRILEKLCFREYGAISLRFGDNFSGGIPNIMISGRVEGIRLLLEVFGPSFCLVVLIVFSMCSAGLGVEN